MDEMELLVSELPGGYASSWSGLSYQERLAGSQAILLYAISILFIFLCLAALYESWSIPFSVILAVPVGIFGAVLASWLFGQDNDVYFKVGMLTTMGLAAKNAILIVEFARALYEEGRSAVDAVLEAVRLRLRPIVMTSLAFSLGVLPLAISTGAGSGRAKRHRHRCPRRHDRRDRSRRLFRPGILRHHRENVRGQIASGNRLIRSACEIWPKVRSRRPAGKPRLLREPRGGR